MCKKLFLLLISFLLLGVASTEAREQGFSVSIKVRKVDGTPTQSGGSKTPVLFPIVDQDGHTIEIETPHAEYVLNIVDSNNIVVYTVVVPSTVSEVELPESLSGTYELQLIQGDLCFYGDITL